jgi:hypothetical protein
MLQALKHAKLVRDRSLYARSKSLQQFQRFFCHWFSEAFGGSGPTYHQSRHPRIAVDK